MGMRVTGLPTSQEEMRTYVSDFAAATDMVRLDFLCSSYGSGERNMTFGRAACKLKVHFADRSIVPWTQRVSLPLI